MPTALIYVRISVDTEVTTSPERQRSDCIAHAERMGWVVAETFEDLDVSGTKDLTRRPGLRSALEAIERGAAQYLIVGRIDRAARSVIGFHEIVQRLSDAGAALVSVAEGLDFATPSGRMVANVLATFAQFESEVIGARVRGSKAHLVSNGKWPGGRRPFGWRPVPHDSGRGYRLALHPDEAPALRDAAERILDGASVGSVAAHLNRTGIRTAHGHEWVGQTLRQSLTKPAMIGRHGAERLLSDADYARLQGRLAKGEPRATKYDHAPTLLAPEVVSCRRCGVPMLPSSGNGGVRVYRCSSRPAPGVGGCFQIAVAHHVDEKVERVLLDTFGDVPLDLTPEAEEVDPAAEERSELVERLGELEQDRYVRGLFSGPAGADRFQAIYAAVEARLAALPVPIVVQSSPSTSTGARTFGEVWGDADHEAKRQWIAGLVDGVVIAPGKGGRKFDTSRVAVRLVL